MAYDKTHLSAMANADGQTWWQYKSDTDSRATIDTEGYFNDAAGMLRENDLVFVIAADAWGFLICNQNDGTTVDMNNGSSIGVGDTD